MAFGYQFQTVGSIGPELIARFGIDYTALGALVGAYMLLGVFGALPIGLLGRRFGEHLVVGVGLSLMAVGSLVCTDIGGVLGATRAIFLGRCLSGVGAVAMIVLQGKMIADWCHGRQLMLGLGISVAAFPTGVGMAQLVAPPLAVAYGWHAAFLFGAFLAALAAVWFVVAYRPSPFANPVPRSFSFPGARECTLVVIAGLIWTFYTSPYSSFLAYAPALLTDRGDSPWLIGLVITIATWGNVPAILLGGGFAMRLGHVRVFLVGEPRGRNVTILQHLLRGRHRGADALRPRRRPVWRRRRRVVCRRRRGAAGHPDVPAAPPAAAVGGRAEAGLTQVALIDPAD